MKKFIISVLLCASIVSTASSMKRVLATENETTLMCLSNEMLEVIVCYLEGESFSRLAQVCSKFREICDATPTRYLAFTFSDAAGHGSMQLIDRFIADRDEWMLAQETGEDIFTLQADVGQNNETKIFRRLLGKGLQDFLGNGSMYCICQNGEIFRYVFIWKNDEQVGDKKPIFIMYLNVKENNSAIARASDECLKLTGIIIPLAGIFNLETSAKIGYCMHGTICTGEMDINGVVFENGQQLDARLKSYRIDSSSDSLVDFDKVFALIAMYIMTKQKNNLHVAYAILDNNSAFDCLPSDILDGAFCNFLGAGYEITDVVDAIRFERKKAIESNDAK